MLISGVYQYLLSKKVHTKQIVICRGTTFFFQDENQTSNFFLATYFLNPTCGLIGPLHATSNKQIMYRALLPI